MPSTEPEGADSCRKIERRRAASTSDVDHSLFPPHRRTLNRCITERLPHSIETLLISHPSLAGLFQNSICSWLALFIRASEQCRRVIIGRA
jgi:hypothetical protein